MSNDSDLRVMPRLPIRFDWPNCQLDRAGGIAVERYKIGEHETVWAMGNVFTTAAVKGFTIRAPMFIERVDDAQIIYGVNKVDATRPLPSACILATYSVLDMIEQRQLAYEGDLDPVLDFRSSIQAVAARYSVDPSEMMGLYPKIRGVFNTLTYSSPHDLDEAMRVKVANDYLDGRL